MNIMDIVKADAFWGLVGAVIGGAVSIVATKMQIKAQNEAQKAQQEEQYNKTILIIMRFIKNEVKHNYEVFLENNTAFPIMLIKNYTYTNFINDYGGYSISSSFEFVTDHYEKFKYEIAYMGNDYANEIIDFYEMFELISTLDFGQWSEEEFYFFKHR